MTGNGPYPPEVLRRFFAPADAPPDAGLPGLLARGAAGACDSGTRVAFEIGVADGRIAAVRYGVYGCPFTVAACSLAAERLRGEPPARLGTLAPEELAAALGVPRERAGRLLIVQDALRNCLADWDNSRSRASP